MSREHCFDCKESFELTDSHKRNYRNSGLCPECFGKAMDYPKDTLEEILAVNKEALENLKLLNVTMLKVLLAISTLEEVE